MASFACIRACLVPIAIGISGITTHRNYQQKDLNVLKKEMMRGGIANAMRASWRVNSFTSQVVQK